ncbi:MAG TPA: hypothetical protein VJT73_19215 [Polyangiaceae bacterium]|nr:hypothetical protein [Polyangiaceae bacterium]
MRPFVAGLWLLSAAMPLSLLARADEGDGGLAPSVIPLVSVTDGGPPAGGFAPDPAPLVTRHQWVVDLSYRSGAIGFGGARRVELAKATPTPRAMGRFAVELYVGKELIDRVRFDFPLLGADEFAGGPRRFDSPPSFERHLSTHAAVVMPHSERATRAVLVDRASGGVWPLPWPFAAKAGAGAAK